MAYEAELDFYKNLDALQKERDKAFATRNKDPERWQKAKHAYAEFRTAIRLASASSSGVSATVVPETANVAAKAKNVGG